MSRDQELRGSVAEEEAGQHRNPYLFVVGAPRSGTTLLKRMIDMHPQIAITPETWWITRHYKNRIGLSADGWVRPQVVPSLFDDKRFPRMLLDRDAVERLIPTNGRISYADFVSGLFDLYGQGKEKPLVGDKTPGYVRNIALLHSLWPEARFVHIIRDGRNVCMSVQSWKKAERTVGHYKTWSEDPAGTLGLWWKWHVGLGREAGQLLPPSRYYELTYEELIADPEGECAKVCDFLGVSYDPAMQRFHEGRTHLTSSHPWVPVTKGLRDWTTQMSTDDLQRFEAVAGDLLENLGYPPGDSGLSSQMIEHGLQMRNEFEARPLPALW